MHPVIKDLLHLITLKIGDCKISFQIFTGNKTHLRNNDISDVKSNTPAMDDY